MRQKTANFFLNGHYLVTSSFQVFLCFPFFCQHLPQLIYTTQYYMYMFFRSFKNCFSKTIINYMIYIYKFYYGLTTLNNPKSRQVYTNYEIITQNIFNTAVSTSVELKTNTKKFYFCGYLISIRCLLNY